MASADTSMFTLELADFAAGDFLVLRFHGREAISEVGFVEVLAVSREMGVDYDEVIGKAATLTIHTGEQDQVLGGIVAELHEEPFGNGMRRFQILIRPKISLLEYSAHCRIFQRKTTREILQQVLEDVGLLAAEIEFDLQQNGESHEFIVQYNESDFDFFCRMAETAGFFWFNVMRGDRQVLVLSDSNQAFVDSGMPQPLEYNPVASLVAEYSLSAYELRRTQAMHTSKARTLGYNYQEPAVRVSGESGAGDQKEWTHFSPQATNAGVAATLSRFIKESRSTLRERLWGKTHCPYLRAATVFTLSSEKGSGFGGNYIVLEALHSGAQESAILGNGSDDHYRNEFNAQPAQMVYRPVLRTTKPQIGGVLIAKTDGPDGDYAILDDQGRYKARLPFDESDAEPGQASCPIRLSQPYSGPGYGLHLPLHKGTDLVLAFEGGDIDRPIALGAAPNPSQKTPVDSANRAQGLLKTAAGHVFRLDDTKDKTLLELISAAGHRLSMFDEESVRSVILETIDKQRLLFDDKGKKLEISFGDGKHALKLDGEKGILTISTGGGHLFVVDDDKKKITLQSASKHTLTIDDEKNCITLADGKGKHSFQIDADGSKVLLSSDGDIEFSAKGAFKVMAKEIALNASSGAVDIKAAQDMNLQGMNLNAKGDQKVQIQAGMDAGIKAGMALKLEGLNVESAAKVANKVTGVQASLEASAMATVKGGVVMIN